MNQVTAPDPERPEPRARVARSGVVVVTLAVAVVVLVAGALVGGVRHQLALSFSRVDPSFVEVYLPVTTTPTAVCSAVAAHTAVPFTIAVHGGGTREVAYTVEVRGRRSSVQVDGRVQGSPGQAVTRTATLRAPRTLLSKPHEVVIEVAGTDQQLLVHCGRGGRAAT